MRSTSPLRHVALLAAVTLLAGCASKRVVVMPATSPACAPTREVLGRLLEGPHACTSSADCAGTDAGGRFQPAPADWRTRHRAEYQAFLDACGALASRYEAAGAATAACVAGTCTLVMRPAAAH